MLILFSSLATAAPPQTMTVSYQTTFDLGGIADQLCSATGLCDCTVTYEGRGSWVRSSGDRHTFEGTYTKTGGSCHEALMLWVPPTQAAYHTVRVADGAVTEWIAHARAGDDQRIQSQIKASGQVWLADFTAALDPATHTAQHVEHDNNTASGIPIASTHRLSVGLHP